MFFEILSEFSGKDGYNNIFITAQSVNPLKNRNDWHMY